VCLCVLTSVACVQCDTSSAPPDATKTVTVPLELSATSKSGVIQVNSETTPSEMAYAFRWSYTGLRAAETLVVSNGDTLLLPYVPVSSITARTVFNAVTLAAGASLHVEVHNAASTPIGSRMQFTKADFSRGTLEVEFVDFAPNATQQAQPSLEVRVPGVFQNIDPLSESKLQFDKLTATPLLADWTIAFVVVNSGDLMLTLRKRTATTTPGAATTSERSATSAATTATATASSPSSSDKASDFLIGLSLTLFVAVAGGICCCLVLCVCVIVIVCLVVRGRRRRDNEYRTDTFGLEHNGSNIDFAHVDYDPPSTLGAPPSLSAAPTLHSAVDHSASMVPPPLARDDGLGSSSSFIPAAIAPDARSAVAYEQPKTITGDDLVLY